MHGYSCTSQFIINIVHINTLHIVFYNVQSINQSVSQSASQPTNQQTNQPTIQSINQSISSEVIIH